MNEIVRQGELLPPEQSDEAYLAEKAGAIRALGKRMIGDIIEIGRLLTEAKQRVGHGNFLPWLNAEFGWDQKTAWNFMQVHEMAAKLGNFPDLTISPSALYALAAPSTPEEIRDETLQRAASGEKITHKEVKRLISEAKEEAEAEARKKVETEHEKALAALKKVHERDIAAIEKRVTTAEAKAEKLAEATAKHKLDVDILERQMKAAEVKHKADKAELAKGLAKVRTEAQEEARIKAASQKGRELAKLMDDLNRELTHYVPPLKWPNKGMKAIFWDSTIALHTVLTKLIGEKTDAERT